MVLVKNWPFFQLFFLGNIAHLLQFLIYAASPPSTLGNGREKTFSIPKNSLK